MELHNKFHAITFKKTKGKRGRYYLADNVFEVGKIITGIPSIFLCVYCCKSFIFTRFVLSRYYKF